MRTNFLIFSFILLTSCGRDIKISTSKLESMSQVTQAGESSLTQSEGILKKMPSSTELIIQGKTLSVSPFSSHMALAFISGMTVGSQREIRFRGILKKTEVILEIVEPK